MTFSSGLISLLALLRELMETLTVTSLLKDIVKGTDEQPVKEVWEAL